jgi:ubiquinone/menaquinone biosynthesis C-methylase UbiE
MENKNILFAELANYYDLIYSFKNYEQEANLVQDLVNQYKQSKGNDLLDVACGSGKHLNYFKSSFQCLGTDLSKDIIEIAKNKISDVDFVQADMISMRLNKQFDVITCLFSSIGYVKTYENLTKTLETFALHLKPGGVVIIEPWFTKEIYRVGEPHMTTYNGDDVKITRMDVSKIDGILSILDFHYLVASKNKDVQYFKDHHELALFEPERFLKIIAQVGLDGRFLNKEPISERGMYIGVKAK